MQVELLVNLLSFGSDAESIMRVYSLDINLSNSYELYMMLERKEWPKMNSSTNQEVIRLKAKVLELELELTVIETGWFKRIMLRTELKKFHAEIDKLQK